MQLEESILIADEHTLCREGWAALLNQRWKGATTTQTGRFAGVISALSGDDSITLVIVDLNLPGLNEMAGIRCIRAHYPNVRIVVTAGSLNRYSIVECLRAGVHGCIDKSLCSAEVAEALTAIRSGRIYVPAMMSDEAEEERPPDVPKLLSGRQREVLDQLAAGKSNKEIAHRLGIAEGTVKVHIHAVFRILGVRNRVGAAAALRNIESVFVPEPALPGLLRPAQRVGDPPDFPTSRERIPRIDGAF